MSRKPIDLLNKELSTPTNSSATKLRKAKKEPQKMTFAICNLSVCSYCNGFTLWHYKSYNDSLDVISSPGYFIDACDMVTAGDMIIVSAKDGGRILFVASADINAVTLAPLS
jgi:hypothetical protein